MGGPVILPGSERRRPPVDPGRRRGGPWPPGSCSQRGSWIIRRARPDILLIDEIDHDPDGRGPQGSQENDRFVGQNGAEPIDCPHRFASEENTGVPIGRDLDGDGKMVVEPGSRAYGNDSFGFGRFSGQSGLVVFAKYPVDRPAVLDFRAFLRKDRPAAILPTRPGGG